MTHTEELVTELKLRAARCRELAEKVTRGVDERLAGKASAYQQAAETLEYALRWDAEEARDVQAI